MHILTTESGPLAGKSFEITAVGVKIGRHPNQNQVVVPDEEISRQHARVYLETDGKVWIEDSSVNGTFVNDRRIQKETLHPGDRIRLGLNPYNTLTYVEERVASAAAASSGSGASVRDVAQARPRSTIKLTGEESGAPLGARLQLVVDRYAVHSIPLKAARTVLGRLSGQDKVAVEGPGVSDAHAELTFSPQGNALLRDLNSEQGTWVNGQRINECALHEGDMIRLGESDARLLLYREAHRRALTLRDIELNRPVTRLGRDSSNEVPLDHPTVSLFHAEVAKRNGNFTIEDKNSTNGTFVNGERIRGLRQLKPHDRITLGAIHLSFDGSQIEQQSDGKGVWLNAYSLYRSVKSNGQKKVLLDGISLAIEPREFVGLLGPSGSGKSTLMNSLSGIHPADQGRVLINQAELHRDHGALRSLMGYVPQDDILHISLTVRECLHYAARLRLPDDFSEKDIAVRVNEVIRKVYLTDHAQKPIYVLSGGQRKRVNLAIELLCKPSLLFLDEPTAGQDPRTEMDLMKLFREVANSGSTIILTTHLLGSFNLLDKVVVLVAGRLSYFGPTQELLHYFHASDPTQVYNSLEDKTKGPEYWAKQFQASEIYREFVANPLGLDTSEPRKTPLNVPQPATAPRHSASRNFSTLLSRLVTLKFKDWTNIAVLVLPPPIIALLLGRMMPNQPNNPKALFIMVIIALWFGCSAAVREIVDERQIYSRERQRNLPIPAYLGSKLVYFAGLAGVQSFLLVGFARLVGLEQEHFLAAWLIIWLMTFHGALLGLLISAWSPNPERALFIFPLVLIPQLLFAGSLIPVRGLILSLPPTEKTKNVPANKDWYQKELDAMSQPIRYGVAPLIAARWGVEALGETYVHDRRFGSPHDPSEPRYSSEILNVFSFTFHDHDAMKEIQAYRREYEESGSRPRATASALPIYLEILGGMAAVMIGWIALVLKLRDRQG
jgi:ABC-type multidrug transport system ATPase subunit/pSer/pThr/pTyr-binding forkhead associated (FHA) protein